jgi:hypothetical protein
VFENRVLGRIYGTRTDEVSGGWRKLNNEELHNLYSSNIVIRMIKSREIRWAGHVPRMLCMINSCNIWLESLEGRDLGVDGRIILKLISRN